MINNQKILKGRLWKASFALSLTPSYLIAHLRCNCYYWFHVYLPVIFCIYIGTHMHVCYFSFFLSSSVFQVFYPSLTFNFLKIASLIGKLKVTVGFISTFQHLYFISPFSTHTHMHKHIYTFFLPQLLKVSSRYYYILSLNIYFSKCYEQGCFLTYKHNHNFITAVTDLIILSNNQSLLKFPQLFLKFPL